MKYATKVSVVMPVHNCEKFIQQSIESILSQTLTDFEFFIINDCSTDSTHDIISRYTNDSRITYITNAKNMGNYKSRNIGMTRANGKYICVMDADDVAHLDRLQIQFEYMERHRQVGCLGTQGMFIDETGNTTGRLDKPTSPSILKVFLLQDNFTLHPSLMLRNKFLKKYGLYYNENIAYAADYDFVVRCSQRFDVHNIKERLLHYRTHENQISNLKSINQVETARRVREMQLRSLGLDLAQNDMKIFNDLMENRQLMQLQIRKGAKLFDKIIEVNKRHKVYKDNSLFAFFREKIISSYQICELCLPGNGS